MNTDGFQLQMYLSLLSTGVPIIVVCVVAGMVIMARRSDAPAAAPYALFGFGLLFVLCFVMPLGQMMLQHWALEDGQRATRMWAFAAFGFANSALHAVIYACLLVAIFAGRPKAGPG